MAKYYVKNKLASIKGSSFVVDEKGNELYEVKGKLISPSEKKFLCDPKGKTIYIIRNKVWHLFCRSIYIYDANKNKVVKMKQRFLKRGFNFPINKYNLQVESEMFKGYHVSVNGVEVGLFRNEGTIMSAFVRDSYELDVYDERYRELLIALVIGLDNMNDAHKKERRNRR